MSNHRLIIYSYNDADPDADAYIAAAGITSTTIQNAITTFVRALKTAGLWGKFHAIYPFPGTTSTINKFNLVNPVDSDAAFRLVFYNNPTHSAGGLQFNGIDQYADTFIGSSTLSKTSWGYGFYSMTNDLTANNQVTGTGTVTGVNTGMYLGLSNRAYIYLNAFDDINLLINSGTTLGLFSGSRNSNTVYLDCRHGTATKSVNAENHNASSLKIGRWSGYANKTCGLYHVANQYLTLAEMATFRGICDNYQTALSRKPF